jgi:cytochrome c oxidase assembly protein subunit 15
VHAVAVILTVVAALGLAWLVRTRPRDRSAFQGPLTLFVGVALAQGLVGYVQYFSGVPVALVAVHIAGATAVWLAAVLLVHRLRTATALDEPRRHLGAPVAASA